MQYFKSLVRLYAWMCFLCLLLQPSHGQQGISTDGTIGTAGAQTLIADSSGAYTIDEALGQKSDNGHNLFYSFDQFNINIGESATFTGDNSIQNVINRVTGGNASMIDGLLRSTIGSADLYFINPAGVIFGPNARLDLPGSFHVSTADYLRMGDEDLFYSEPMDGEVMSIAAPTAFGFLDLPDGGIEVDGAKLSVSEGATLSLVGGTVKVKNRAQLDASAGQVNLVSAGAAGKVVFVTENGDLDSSGLSALGAVSVVEDSAVNTNGSGGGRIFIRGGQVVVKDSALSARTSGDTDGKGVDVMAVGPMDFVRSLIDTRTSGNGDAGDVNIHADRIVYDLLGASGTVGILVDFVSKGIRFFLDITYPLSSELTAKIVSPSGTEVVLFSNIAGLGGNFTNTVFSDSAGSSITEVSAPFSGEFIPEGSLSSFIGEEFNGVWTLWINDYLSPINSGTLNSWGLELEGTQFNSSDLPKTIGEFGTSWKGVLPVPYSIPDISSTLAVSGVEPGKGSAGAITITANQMETLVDSDNLHISATSVEPGVLTLDLGTVTRYGYELNPDLLRIHEGHALLESRIAYDGSLAGYSGLALKSGDEYLIKPEYGYVDSDTLFHSFSDFVLFKGETAKFQSDQDIARILARVIGGDLLFVDGLLQSVAPDVDLFLFNPTGIVFGPHGRVDLNASFASLAVSTADFLAWDDGAVRFDANEPVLAKQNLLTAGEPDVFGFLEGPIGRIDVLGGSWTTDSGASISFIGGNLRFANPDGTAGAIKATSGAINLISLGSSGDLGFDATSSLFDTTDFEAFGTIHLDRFRLDVSSDSVPDYLSNLVGEITSDPLEAIRSFDPAASEQFLNGSMFVRGGSLTLSNDASFKATTSALKSGVSGELIEIAIEDDMKLLSGGKIDVSTEFLSLANGGSVSIRAGNLTLDDKASGSGAAIFSRSRGSGNSGDVTIRVGETLQILNGASINVGADSLGNGGNVFIDADNLTISNEIHTSETGIRSRTFGTGDAGNVVIDVEEDFYILNGATIKASAWFLGDGGNVTIDAGNLTLDNGNFGSETAVFSRTYGDGNGGDVSIDIDDHLQILGGATIDVNVYSLGDGGNVSIDTNYLTIDSKGSNSKTAIFAQTFGRGDAGDVSIDVDDHLQLLSGASIDVSAFMFGDGGNVSIDANNLTIDGNGSRSRTAIFSQTLGAGDAGNITIDVDDHLQLLDGGSIDVSSYAIGEGGNVSIDANNLTIDGNGSRSRTAIFSQTLGAGDAGNITIDVDDHLQLLDGGSIDVSSYAIGEGGDVSIDADKLTIDDGGNSAQTALFSQTYGAGNAGDITINVDNHLQLLNGASMDVSAYSFGEGGDVLINAMNLTLDNDAGSTAETAIRSRTFSNGAAGDVSIIIDKQLQILNGGKVDVSTGPFGGDVLIAIEKPLQLLEEVGKQLPFFDDIGEQLQFFSTAGEQLQFLNGVEDLLLFPSESIEQLRLLEEVGEQLPTFDEISERLQLLVNVGEPLQVINAIGERLQAIDLGDLDVSLSSSGSAGNIFISSGDTLRIQDSGSISSNTLSKGIGGDIRIKGNVLLLLEGATISSSSESTDLKSILPAMPVELILK